MVDYAAHAMRNQAGHCCPRVVTDGPYAESKEYCLSVPDDERRLRQRPPPERGGKLVVDEVRAESA
ncbi:hypothetical protein AB0E69_13750 [Kribbella sp. NPDC026611]|uniref:hypothetical protein n=1 Tax=Kribbella sp. NPDC026611 TaxID=3154911 RepID=UPI0033EDC6EC